MENKTTRRTIASSQAIQAHCEVIIDPVSGFRSLKALTAFKKGQVIHPFTYGKVHKSPNYLTVQLGEQRHIELAPAFLECINHSCDPNVCFDTTLMQVIALKPIKKGEELTYFYPSTEWDMDQSFICNCNTTQCLGVIRGARYVQDELKPRYRFSEFIQQKFRES